MRVRSFADNTFDDAHTMDVVVLPGRAIEVVFSPGRQRFGSVVSQWWRPYGFSVRMQHTSNLTPSGSAKKTA